VQIKFRRDTSFRKELFTPESFAHPAKMDAQLLIWIVERYTKVGETILDPMAGMGTTMLACMLGRNCILVELEQKFVDMAKANWEKVRMMPQLGYEMGQCQIIQGDARNLEGLFKEPKCLHGYQRHYYKFNDKCMHCGHKRGDLVLVDGIITSPPFAGANQRQDIEFLKKIAADQSEKYRTGENQGHYASPEAITRYYGKQSLDASPNNIQNLPYGSIDSVITSPPYAEAQEGAGIAKRGYQGSKHSPTDLIGKRSYMPGVHGESEGQIGNKPYGNIDSIITSPPYEGSFTHSEQDPEARLQRLREVDREGVKRGDKWATTSDEALRRRLAAQDGGYGSMVDNIGNLKADSYLSAMLQVYQQCRKVLKPQGLMILVTKNFIRDQREIRLDSDTIELCKQAGFQFLERHYRKLLGQSFWRVIYQQKYPEAPVLDKEDILVFQRQA